MNYDEFRRISVLHCSKIEFMIRFHLLFSVNTQSIDKQQLMSANWQLANIREFYANKRKKKNKKPITDIIEKHLHFSCHFRPVWPTDRQGNDFEHRIKSLSAVGCCCSPFQANSIYLYCHYSFWECVCVCVMNAPLVVWDSLPSIFLSFTQSSHSEFGS